MSVFDSGKGLFSWLAVTSGFFFFSLPGLTFPLEECQSMCNPIPLFTPCWKSYTSARYIRDMAFGNSLIFLPDFFFSIPVLLIFSSASMNLSHVWKRVELKVFSWSNPRANLPCLAGAQTDCLPCQIWQLTSHTPRFPFGFNLSKR